MERDKGKWNGLHRTMTLNESLLSNGCDTIYLSYAMGQLSLSYDRRISMNVVQFEIFTLFFHEG